MPVNGDKDANQHVLQLRHIGLMDELFYAGRQIDRFKILKLPAVK